LSVKLIQQINEPLTKNRWPGVNLPKGNEPMTTPNDLAFLDAMPVSRIR